MKKGDEKRDSSKGALIIPTTLPKHNSNEQKHVKEKQMRRRIMTNMYSLHFQCQWAGGHFIFWAEYLGLIVISFVDAAKIDKGYGQYYQIGIIKYAFLD